MYCDTSSGFGLSTAPIMTNGKTRSVGVEWPTGIRRNLTAYFPHCLRLKDILQA